MVEGWKCPSCKKVHAPFVLSCDCHLVAHPMQPLGDQFMAICGCRVGSVCGNTECPHRVVVTC